MPKNQADLSEKERLLQKNECFSSTKRYLSFTIMNVATESVEITPRGIRKVLNKYTPQRAIAEYIWNGYDAHAKEVRVNTICENIFDSIIKVIVRDDGVGIIHEQLPVVFKKYYESHKSVKGNVDSRFSRGKNGYGRFTFFKFANLATWHTIYKKKDAFINTPLT